MHVHVYGFIHTQGFKMHSNYWWLNKFLFTPKLTPTGFFNHLGGFWSGITFCVFSVTGVACANGSLELKASATYPNSDTFQSDVDIIKINSTQIMNHSFMKIVNSLKFKMCESFNFINTLLLWWIGCPPPIREYTVTCPSKEELEITAGFRGHHFTSKHHWLLVGSSYTTWAKKFWF